MSLRKHTDLVVLVALVPVLFCVFPSRVDAQLVRSSEVQKDGVTMRADFRGSSRIGEFELNVYVSNNRAVTIFVIDIEEWMGSVGMLFREPECDVIDLGGRWVFKPGTLLDVTLVRVLPGQLVHFRSVNTFLELDKRGSHVCISIGLVQEYESRLFEWGRPSTTADLHTRDEEAIAFDTNLERVQLGPFPLIEFIRFDN